MDRLPDPRPMAVTFGGRVPLEDIVGRDQTVADLWASSSVTQSG
jgi:hypothetical protein